MDSFWAAGFWADDFWAAGFWTTEGPPVGNLLYVNGNPVTDTSGAMRFTL